MVIKGFFFDLDGTLVDTHRANYESYRMALAEMGTDITFDDFKKTIGHQGRTFLPWLMPGIDEAGLDQVAERKAVHYKELMHLSVLNSKLITFIDSMRSEHAIVLVTTAKRRNATAVLEHHKLLDKFDYIITSEDVAESKPSPEGYKLALQKTGLTSNQAIAFEDSDIGKQAAEAAGLSVIMVRDYVL